MQRNFYHRCNDACLVRRPDGTFRCRKIDNVKATPDNRSHQYIPLPNNYSVECLKVLDKVGLLEELDIDDDNNVKHFKSSLPFFILSGMFLQPTPQMI